MAEDKNQLDHSFISPDIIVRVLDRQYGLWIGREYCLV